MKTKHIYTLDLQGYNKEFDSVNDLIDDVKNLYLHPNTAILRDGIKTGETLDDYIGYLTF